MRLSWNEIRVRAAEFAREWASAHYERGDTQTFYNEFFEIFGVRRRKVASFEEPVRLLGEKRGFIDLFWRGKLLVEQKSTGRNLARARQQALDYFPGLKDHELPRYVLLCDFQTFELIDLETREEVRFALADLPAHVEAFGFIAGVERRVFRDQDPVNIIAAELMGKLHDALKASGYQGHRLERLLVRLLFCLFADDTGIFDELGAFESLIRDRTSEDGADVGSWLIHLFQVLDTPSEERQSNLDDDLAKFLYINGDLFGEPLPIPSFNTAMRNRLLEACTFSWEKISPAIFGALFQSVMNAKERRAKGAHYTTEKNILKVIEPLFLDDLRADFRKILDLKRGREQALILFKSKLAALKLFDPACGCGNFLVIAYRELRSLEIDVLKALYPEGQRDLEAAALSQVDVDQFYGIEIDEFPARIAETAMWMMDHIMNNRLSLEFGQVFARIPLKAAPHISHGDALDIKWDAVLPAEQCDFVFGNPPFLGQSHQSEKQREQMQQIVGGDDGRAGSLDYVSAWFLKSAVYLSNSKARVAFVCTNSVTQGEQVAQLWPTLFRAGFEIAFAHGTFAWGSDARGMAHVHVVIVGLARRDALSGERRLFTYDDPHGDPQEARYAVISPYLCDASRLADPHLVIRERSTPIGNAPPLVYGSKPVDDGAFLFTASEHEKFIENEPGAAELFRPMVSAHEYLHGEARWCLWLVGANPGLIRSLPAVMEKVQHVRDFRSNSKKVPTQKAAQRATEFAEVRQRRVSYVLIPMHTSENRVYVPFGFFDSETIVHNSCTCMPEGGLEHFAVISSNMHMAWMKQVCGRLESRFRYSNSLVYNTFPWPEISLSDQEKLKKLGQKILTARASFSGVSLADLYDPAVMPIELPRAHAFLDLAVDRLYRRARFESDRERVEHLFMLYESLTAGFLAHVKPGRRRRK